MAITKAQLVEPIYKAIKRWQDGVMNDLPEWSDAGPDDGPVQVATWAAEIIERLIEDEMFEVRADARSEGYAEAREDHRYDD